MADVYRWRPVAVLVLLMLGLQLIGPEALRYDTRSIHQWELWRLLTGHGVHANWKHYGMNMLGFALCLALTTVNWSLWQWLWRIGVLAIGISLLFVLFKSTLGWYVGFSGVLFGLYVLAAVDSIDRQSFISLTLLAFIAIKIALEQGASVNITSADWIGVPVLVDAHLYGVMTAVLILLLQSASKRILNT